MEKSDSANLRDFLQVKEDDHSDGRHNMTTSNMLSAEKRTQSNKTLLDIIRDDPTVCHKDNKKSWKHFKEKLKLRRAGSGGGASWTSSVHTPASDVPIQQGGDRMFSRRVSTRYTTPNVPDSEDDPTTESSQPEMFADSGVEYRGALNSLSRNSSRAMTLRRTTSSAPDRRLTTSASNISDLAEPNHRAAFPEVAEEEKEDEEAEEKEEEEGTEEGEGQVKMSLMALLAEGDNEMGLSSFMMDGDEEEEDEEEEESGRGSGDYNNCCVCMVRHKGAAFIPCGHTFCRLCSRELWVQRGNCPLCNGFISEILDIF